MRLQIGRSVEHMVALRSVISFGLFSIKTADSAQPRNRSMVTRPLSSCEGGVWARDYTEKPWRA